MDDSNETFLGITRGDRLVVGVLVVAARVADEPVLPLARLADERPRARLHPAGGHDRVGPLALGGVVEPVSVQARPEEARVQLQRARRAPPRLPSLPRARVELLRPPRSLAHRARACNLRAKQKTRLGAQEPVDVQHGRHERVPGGGARLRPVISATAIPTLVPSARRAVSAPSAVLVVA